MLDIADAPPDTPWEPWQPKIGQRVRIRLSRECDMRLDPDAGVVRRGDARAGDPAHNPDEDGRLGVVERHIEPGKSPSGDDSLRHGHAWFVRWVVPMKVGRGSYSGADYAACELEPLEETP